MTYVFSTFKHGRSMRYAISYAGSHEPRSFPAMSRAVRFDEYGDGGVLNVVEVPDAVPGPGELLVRVKGAGINRGEGKIRQGLRHELWPATFPSGQGSDLAGVVEAVGD